VSAATDWDRLPQPKRFHSPLQQGDTETMTFGCRHTNPDICCNNSLPGICAFVRKDGMCHCPPKSWPRQYQKLLAAEQTARVVD